MSGKSLNTEIISVGTELLLGHVTNTDARDVSEELSKIGLNVRYHTVVGDNPERLRACMELAKSRADVIITTGGLGPTCDDLTKLIAAEAFSLPLVEDAREMAGLYEYIKNGRVFTDNNFNQALLPEGCTVFHNSCGTAPGCAFEKDGKVVVMLPGPPKECRAMLVESAIPYLRRLGDGEIVSHSVRVFGLGESAVDDMFADEMNAMTNPSMAPYAKECDCLVQITAKADTAAEAEAMIAPVVAHVKENLGEYVYGEDVETLEEAAMKLLRQTPLTFATAESCTGGEVAKRFTDLPGASEFFLGGVVTYTNAAKATLLGIDPALIEEKGAVSDEVAREMASRVRTLLGADIGFGVTGLAGPDGDGVHEVGTVFVSMDDGDKLTVRQLRLGTNRTRSFIRRMAGNHIYDMLRRRLQGLEI